MGTFIFSFLLTTLAIMFGWKLTDNQLSHIIKAGSQFSHIIKAGDQLSHIINK